MQAAPVGVGQVEGDDLYAGEPALRALGGPISQLLGALSLEEVDQEPAVQIDEGGRVDGLVGGRRRQVAVLVDPECSHLSDPSRVVDQGRAVADDGGHHRVPAHPVLGCD